MEENVRERESEQPKDGKNTSPFLERESERERVFSRVFGGGGTERGVRDGVVCVVVSSKRALKGKETVCAPKRGLFLSVSDLFLGKHTTKERDIFLVIFEDSLR